jgi:hypothetical protein
VPAKARIQLARSNIGCYILRFPRSKTIALAVIPVAEMIEAHTVLEGDARSDLP